LAGDLSNPDSGFLKAIAKQAPHVVSDHISADLIVKVDFDGPSLWAAVAPDPVFFAGASNDDVDSF
jgi:hypothetical protein